MAGLRVAVVGSGPSGAYAVQELCDSAADVAVDVFERLPVPYGLVRYGVAPDHPRIKSIVGSFSEIFAHPAVRFVGNVEFGQDVTLAQLREHYDAVIFASGAIADRRLAIPGEDLPGVCSATDFVAWYSGHPDAAVDRFALTAQHAVLVGLGNVALDVGRMLCRTADELRETDVPEHVVDVLARSTIREITIVGRKGPAQAKFSTKELGELRELTDTRVVADPAEFSEELPAASGPIARRMLDTLRGYADNPTSGEHRLLRFAFHRTPVAVTGAEAATGLAVVRALPDLPPEQETLPAEFIVRSVGYRGITIPGLPFDESTGTVPNAVGRVLDGEEPVTGVYVTGWIKRGPSGVIGTNKRCAGETVAALLADQAAASTTRHETEADLVEQLRASGSDVVSWSGWQQIDAAEQAEGRAAGRERIKLHERARLLAAASVAR
jgi:ferredoxin/flavodoxin---NADP+ reductase